VLGGVGVGVHGVLLYSMKYIYNSVNEITNENKLYELEIDDIISDIRHYTTEPDKINAMTMWAQIQKKISALRKKTEKTYQA